MTALTLTLALLACAGKEDPTLAEADTAVTADIADSPSPDADDTAAGDSAAEDSDGSDSAPDTSAPEDSGGGSDGGDTAPPGDTGVPDSTDDGGPGVDTGTVAPSPCEGETVGYAVGECAVDFTLFDETGVERSLYDYAGQVILLEFSAFW